METTSWENGRVVDQNSGGKMTKETKTDKATHGKIIMTEKKERKGKWINGPQHEQWKTLEKSKQKIID